MLRNRKENKEPKLVGVNRVADPIKMKLGSFQSLENFIQAHRYKLKKKRGPEPLVSCTPEPPEPEVCDDATPRGQCHLAEELRFTNNSSTGGTRTSWGYISPDEELYTSVGNAACGGGNMNYDICCEINHFVGAGLPLDHPALVPPLFAAEFVNSLIGVSDVPIYANNTHFPDGNGVFYPATNTSMILDVVSTNVFGYETFAKRGNDFYALGVNFGSGDSGHRIARFDATTGVVIGSLTFALSSQTMAGASATDNFLYGLSFLTANSTIQTLSKIDKTALTVVDTFDLTTIDTAAIYTVSDDLIYILNSHGALYYVENFTNLVYVGTFAPTITNFGLHGFFTNGSFYYGATGFGSVSTNIFRVTLPCPEGDPIIASVTTGPEVAAGGSLDVDWADVLEPGVNDKLYLKAVDGTLFDPTPLASFTPATGASSGSISFPVPGGTTPGSYVMQYVYAGINLVATSAPFTVT